MVNALSIPPQVNTYHDNTNLRRLLFETHGGEVVLVGVDERHHALVVAIEGNSRAAEQHHLRNIISRKSTKTAHLSRDVQRVQRERISYLLPLVIDKAL